MSSSVVSNAAAAARELLVRLKAAVMLGMLDAQQQTIDLAFAEQPAATVEGSKAGDPSDEADQTPVQSQGGAGSALRRLNPETMSILHGADGDTQACQRCDVHSQGDSNMREAKCCTT